jgi:hypothetical protein
VVVVAAAVGARGSGVRSKAVHWKMR